MWKRATECVDNMTDKDLDNEKLDKLITWCNGYEECKVWKK